MAMNTSTAGDDEPILDINTTPLIDVMLVLLVMLIITIPIQLHAVHLNMPVGIPPPQVVKPEVVKIDIDGKNAVYWNGTPVASRIELEGLMQAAAALPLQPEVHIRPNKASRYEVFVEVMVSANKLGLAKLGVVGAEQFMPGAAGQ
ncbi:MAG: biopolymer transporter ExbD [Burkholderiales bacterium]